MKRGLVLVSFIFCKVVWGTTFAPRDADYVLRRISAKDGAIEWTWPLPPQCQAYRLEKHGDRLLLFYHRPFARIAGERPDPADITRVVFLDASTGKTAEPFDTRHFHYASENRLLASSTAYRPMLDDIHEIYLPGKRWITFGMGRRNWDGTTLLHFFDVTSTMNERVLVWTIDLPRARNIQNHGDTLIFSRYARSGGEIAVGEVAAIAAGESKTLWSFQLPADVETVIYPALPPGTPRPSRYLEHAVSGTNVIVYGNGHVFALDPATGAVRWRHHVSTNTELSSTWAHFQHARPVRSRDLDSALLFTGPYHPADQTLLRVEPDGSMRILTRELCDGDMTLLAADGAIFHMKAIDRPEH